MIKRAVIQVENTENLADFASFLVSDGWTILSANKTEEILRNQKIPVTHEVALSENNAYINETSALIRRIMMSRYDAPQSSRVETEENNIFIVCMNLTPQINPNINTKQFDNQLCPPNFFVSTVIRNAFRNYANLLILTDPADYKEATIQLKTDNITDEFRVYLAAKALNMVAAYDAGLSASILGSKPYQENFPNYLALPFKKEFPLHNGLNQNQTAYFYKSPTENSTGNFLKSVGKDLSYTVFSDVAYAWGKIDSIYALLKNQTTVKSINSDGYEFTTQFTPLSGTVFTVAVKFNTILGAALSASVLDSFRNTYTYDSRITIDAVFACSAVINTEAATEIAKCNFAAIVAPSFTTEAKQILSVNKKTKLIPSTRITNVNLEGSLINGGIILQTKETTLFNQWKVRTKNRPSQLQTDEMVFGMMLVMGAHSYSAVLLKQNMICGISQSCTSTEGAITGVLYEAMKHCERSSGIENVHPGIDASVDTSNLGDVLVCDSEIPFCEAVKRLIDKGVKAILQTGGTPLDSEFIDYCNERGVVMVFTGITHLSF